MAYHTHHLQARQVREIHYTHTHTIQDVRENDIRLDALTLTHTHTSPHFSLISPVPAAAYRNSFSHELTVPRRQPLSKLLKVSKSHFSENKRDDSTCFQPSFA